MSKKEKKKHTKRNLKTSPATHYFKTNKEYGDALGRDFITAANKQFEKGKCFLVGLAHGQSPTPAFKYILKHYHELSHPELIWYTFTNSRLVRQRNLEGIMDSQTFIRTLLKKQLVTYDNIFGAKFNRDDLAGFVKKYNKEVSEFLKEKGKKGYDYVFVASDVKGRIAGITRNSSAFESTDIMTLVYNENEDPEITVTPHFLLKANRIAYMATRAKKRRSLAWLYSKFSHSHESPSFLRYIKNVDEKLNVFIDDAALTWPQILIKRKTINGISNIKLDLAIPYDESAEEKLPVVLLLHGFLGLNSYDGMLTHIPSHKYIAAAMHYGTFPKNLRAAQYSEHVANNIDEVISYFGKKGHDVYILDHSIANTYFLILDRNYTKLDGVQKYLKGRIGINPFFSEESKHALKGFLDYVIIPAISFSDNPGWKTAVIGTRKLVPFDSKKGVRKKGIKITKWLIRGDNKENPIWESVKDKILQILTTMDSLPALDVIPLKKALGRLNAKIFGIQIYAALEDYKFFDGQKGLLNFNQQNLPILILKSENDAIAKFVPRMYENSNVKVVDVTNEKENNLFREHLYYMVNPIKTVKIIDDFISNTEEKNA